MNDTALKIERERALALGKVASEINVTAYAQLHALPEWNIRVALWSGAPFLVADECDDFDAVVPGANAKDARDYWLLTSGQNPGDYIFIEAIPEGTPEEG